MFKNSLLGNLLSKTILFGVAAVAFVTTASAHPVDRKTYPGSSCQAGPFASPGSLAYSIDGFVTNNASGSVWIVCPIIYDVFDEDRLPGLRGMRHGGVSVSVRIAKSNSSGFICELRSKTTHGVGEILQAVSNFDGAGIRTINFTDNTWFTNGYYVLACIVPPGHSIRSYQATEH